MIDDLIDLTNRQDARLIQQALLLQRQALAAAGKALPTRQGELLAQVSRAASRTFIWPKSDIDTDLEVREGSSDQNAFLLGWEAAALLQVGQRHARRLLTQQGYTRPQYGRWRRDDVLALVAKRQRTST